MATIPTSLPALHEEDGDTYRALVVDSGPIIRMTGLTSLRDKARLYYTVPAVIQEIRDAKARQHLEQLPFDIQTRDPSAESVQAVIEFARLTGDYQSLSSVDIQVLALQYDLEQEGCGIDHIRRTPKRTVGGGRVESMGERKKGGKSVEADKAGGNNTAAVVSMPGNTTFFESHNIDIVEEDDDDDEDEEEDPAQPSGPKSWAVLVNPTAASKATAVPDIAEQALTVPFGQMKLVPDADAGASGQFSDAEDDDFDPTPQNDEDDDADYANSDCDISDEECDVYILDPEEVEERNRVKEEAKAVAVEEELQSDFPSLGASLNVPYAGGDSDNERETVSAAILAKQQAEQKKQESLKPVTNSGKMYNSFRKYGDVVKPKEEKPEQEKEEEDDEEDQQEVAVNEPEEPRDTQSRIIGGTGMSGQETQVEDDGEGWITSTKDIRKMKAAGRLNPTTTPASVDKDNRKSLTAGPAIPLRTACATTDFAMQNVILQMNLELLSVDGMKVRRLKSWVSRCGACFTVFSNDSNNGPYEAKRLFCSRCGSDMIQRIACSVDAKTGRLRLHLSKKYRTSARGTKFSLPKPGSNNRFQGDLLLREDQMLMGAWNQKVKKLSGGKSKAAASSMFGSDLAANVGCHAKTVHMDDVRVGFGRRNPNSAKGGRERRGKKKKSGDKACGLRRY